MPGPIIISYVNWSTTTFQQSGSYTGLSTQAGVSMLTQTPSSTLGPQGANTTMRMDDSAIAAIMGGDAWISLGWKDPAANYYFGVKIIVPLQVLGMGDRPYYQTAYGTSSGPSWTTSVSDPGTHYTFPQTNFLIDCSPDSEHTSLAVSVTIYDLA